MSKYYQSTIGETMGRKWMKKRPFNRTNLEDVPNVSGIYELIDARDRTIYAGKSNHLRDRLYHM